MLVSKVSAFPEAFIPSTFAESIRSLRQEAGQRLGAVPALTARLEAFFDDHAKLKNMKRNPDADKLLAHCPVPMIDLFYQLSKSATGIYYGHQFRVDPYPKTLKKVQGTEAEKWSWEFKSSAPLLFCVEFANGIGKHQFRRITGTLPRGGVREKKQHVWLDRHNVGWVVGLTCDEREVLLLHPLVKDVRPHQPYFHMSMAFD